MTAQAALENAPSMTEKTMIDLAEAKKHAKALRQCSLFARDVGDHVAEAMLEAADYLEKLDPEHLKLIRRPLPPSEILSH